jgi:hypothetical protein
MALAPLRACLVFLPVSFDKAKPKSTMIEKTKKYTSNIFNSFKNIMLFEKSEANIIALTFLIAQKMFVCSLHFMLNGAIFNRIISLD